MIQQRRAFITFPEVVGTSAPVDFSNQKKLEGVNIRFNVETFSPVGVTSRANIVIYNLNKSDLSALTTSSLSWLAKRAYIQLYAGYSDNCKCIFSGQISNAPPEGNPDIGLHITGISNVDWMAQTINLQKNEIEIIDLIDHVGKVTNTNILMPGWLRTSNEWLHKKIKNFSYTGTPMGLLKYISNSWGGFSFDKNTPYINIFNDQIYVWSAENKNATHLLVNENTGLIGYPRPTSAGVEVTVLMNPSIKVGDMIKLESKRIPLINGEYFVVSINHEGELRGNNWYTHLKCSHTSNWQKEVLENG